MPDCTELTSFLTERCSDVEQLRVISFGDQKSRSDGAKSFCIYFSDSSLSNDLLSKPDENIPRVPMRRITLDDATVNNNTL